MKVHNKTKFNLYVRIILIILLLIVCIITSFRTGQRYYDLKNTQLKDSNSQVETDIAKWNFKVKIVY